MSNPLLNKKTRNQKHDIIDELHGNSILFDTREIFLHGEIDSENGDAGTDFRMANKFLKNLRLLEGCSVDPIVVHQHNIGGDWECGMIMYDAIANSSCHIILVMYGSACSMGSIIPQGADTRIVMPNTLFLIHNGYTGIHSSLTCKQATQWYELEQHIKETMLEIYTKTCVNGSFFIHENMDDKKVRKFIADKMDQKEDWFLFARDAVRYGFADSVLGDEGHETIDIIKENLINE